jgi:hypothetical protein
MFHGVSLRDSDTLAVVAGAISDFLSATHDPDADVLGLVFVNFQPSTHFSVRPRPHTVLSVPDLAAGLRSFSVWVVGSIQDQGSPCEWVMLYCSRRPIKS